MTQEQQNEFKGKVYDPYNEAWHIMKTLRDTDIRNDADMKAYDDKCEAFRKKYQTEIGETIYRVLIDAACEVGKIYGKG